MKISMKQVMLGLVFAVSSLSVGCMPGMMGGLMGGGLLGGGGMGNNQFNNNMPPPPRPLGLASDAGSYTTKLPYVATTNGNPVPDGGYLYGNPNFK